MSKLRPDSTRERVTAGKRDRRITLKRAVDPDEDAAGNPIPGTDEPITLARWAKYSPVSDSERMAAKEVSAEYSARFVIRWSPAVKDVSPVWWLTFEGRDYNIEATKEIGRREGIELTASTRTE